MRPDDAIYLPWVIWIISWIAAALWANRTVKRPADGREWPYRSLELGGYALLLFFVAPLRSHAIKNTAASDYLTHRLWALPQAADWAMVALASAGFLFCWWARLHLGRLWSGWVTKKEGHRVIDTGPYAIVRHPIYTGILTAVIATAAEKGTGFATVGAILLILGYWLKARVEEHFLRQELSADAYNAFRRRVPMLVPFGPKAP